MANHVNHVNHSTGDHPMTLNRPPRFRRLVAVVLMSLIASACSGATTNTSETPSTPAPVDEVEEQTADVDEQPDVVDDPPDTEPLADPPTDEPATATVALALSPDPDGSTDPLETINHLESVNVWSADGGVAVQFPAMDNGGLRVEINDADQGVDVFCDLYQGPDGLLSNCSGFNHETGQFLDPEDAEILGEPADGYTYVVPLAADQDYVTITFGGVSYQAPFVIFSDSPGMVQLNPDGSLAAAVVRTVGTATAAELATATS